MTGDSNGQVSLIKKTGPNESLRRERMKDFDDGGVWRDSQAHRDCL